jgi:hypothetical protein
MMYEGLRYVRSVQLFGATGLSWPLTTNANILAFTNNTFAEVFDVGSGTPINDPAATFTIDNADNLDYCLLNIAGQITDGNLNNDFIATGGFLKIGVWGAPFSARILAADPLFSGHAVLENAPVSGVVGDAWYPSGQGAVSAANHASPPNFGMSVSSAGAQTVTGCLLVGNSSTDGIFITGDRFWITVPIGNAVQKGFPSISGLSRIYARFLWTTDNTVFNPETVLFDMQIWASLFECAPKHRDQYDE